MRRTTFNYDEAIKKTPPFQVCASCRTPHHRKDPCPANPTRRKR